jgi:hypothetical protein
MVLDVTHDLPHEVDAQSDRGSFRESRGEIGRGHLSGVERCAAVGVFQDYTVRQGQEIDFGSAFQTFAASVADAVDKKFFQHQDKVEFHIRREAVPAAELLDFSRQSREFAQVAVEYQLLSLTRESAYFAGIIVSFKFTGLASLAVSVSPLPS